MNVLPTAPVPVAEVHDLSNYDGLLIGFPARCRFPPQHLYD